jgi:hypothetical protein
MLRSPVVIGELPELRGQPTASRTTPFSGSTDTG